MISVYARWIRFLLSIVLILVFAALAYLLYKKQQEKYTYSSFKIENENFSILIPNVDRLKTKIRQPQDLMTPPMPALLQQAIQAVIDQPLFNFSQHLSK